MSKKIIGVFRLENGKKGYSDIDGGIDFVTNANFNTMEEVLQAVVKQYGKSTLISGEVSVAAIKKYGMKPYVV